MIPLMPATNFSNEQGPLNKYTTHTLSSDEFVGSIDTLIFIDITGECNWGCSYCNAPYKYSSGDISKALKISKLFKLRTINYNHDDVTFIIEGGEPSIYGKQYNQSIITTIRKLHKVHVPIWYISNLSATVDFYTELDIDTYVFSYHPSHIEFIDFITKFEQVLTYKKGFIRVANVDKETFVRNITNYNIALINYILWYDINDDIDGSNLPIVINANNVYELR